MEPEDFMYPPSSRSTNNTNKLDIMKRTMMSPKIEWKDPEMFHNFKNAVEGHFRQCHTGYLFNEEFQCLYKEHGMDAVNFWEVEPGFPTISKLQFKLDTQFLLGALQSSIKTSLGTSDLIKYGKAQDRLGAWIEINRKFDEGGSKQNRINELEAKISVPFSCNYGGGFRQFISDYEHAFSELEQLGEDNWSRDEAKKRKVSQNLTASGFSWFKSAIRTLSFEETCNLLRELAIDRDCVARERANAKANGAINSVQANLSFIERAIFEKLPEDIRKLIQKWREEEKKKTSSQPTQETKVNSAKVKGYEDITPEQLASIANYLNEDSSDDGDWDDIHISQ